VTPAICQIAAVDDLSDRGCWKNELEKMNSAEKMPGFDCSKPGICFLI